MTIQVEVGQVWYVTEDADRITATETKLTIVDVRKKGSSFTTSGDPEMLVFQAKELNALSRYQGLSWDVAFLEDFYTLAKPDVEEVTVLPEEREVQLRVREFRKFRENMLNLPAVLALKVEQYSLTRLAQELDEQTDFVDDVDFNTLSIAMSPLAFRLCFNVGTCDVINTLGSKKLKAFIKMSDNTFNKLLRKFEKENKIEIS